VRISSFAFDSSESGKAGFRSSSASVPRRSGRLRERAEPEIEVS
jgi:hypothetical protein